MGTDITAYVECNAPGNTEGSYYSLAQFWLPRIRALFAAMGARDSEAALYRPRGLPPDCCWTVRDAFHLTVVDPEVEPACYGEVYMTREAADEAIAEGKASYTDEDGNTVTNPYYFSPSWLTRPEIVETLTHAGFEPDSYPTEFLALLALMEHLEKTVRVRLVFWFDA